jgi:predicted DNA-binding protein
MNNIVCEFCGDSFIAYDNHRRKYCPKCQKSDKRFAKQFSDRKKRDIVCKIYSYNYSKCHALYKKNKIKKAALDDWRLHAGEKKREIKTGQTTVEDFKAWCDEAYEYVKHGGSYSSVERAESDISLDAGRTIALRINANLYKRLKMRLAETGTTLTSYIPSLIENDLKNQPPLTLENFMISEESVKEAQKILDFVRNTLINRKEEIV